MYKTQAGILPPYIVNFFCSQTIKLSTEFEFVFECVECGKSFDSQQYFTQHMMTSHGELMEQGCWILILKGFTTINYKFAVCELENFWIYVKASNVLAESSSCTSHHNWEVVQKRRKPNFILYSICLKTFVFNSKMNIQNVVGIAICPRECYQAVIKGTSVV